MTQVMHPPRLHPAPGTATALRTREPRGLIDPADATARLAGLMGRRLVGVGTSLGRIVLSIDAEPLHLLVVPWPVQWTDAQGRSRSVEGADAVGLLTGWAGRPVCELIVDDGGGLHVGLGDDRIEVAAEAAHEAWEIRGMDGGLMVCLPGGRISVWAPTFGRIPRAHSTGR